MSKRERAHPQLLKIVFLLTTQKETPSGLSLFETRIEPFYKCPNGTAINSTKRTHKPSLALALASFFTAVCSLRLDHRDLNASSLDRYDYIIVGGGVSGLVVANRLTEDPGITVPVLESGSL
jgi:hypothetical protein